MRVGMMKFETPSAPFLPFVSMDCLRRGEDSLGLLSNLCPAQEQVKGFLLAQLMANAVETLLFLQLGFEARHAFVARLGHLGQSLFQLRFAHLDLLFGGN